MSEETRGCNGYGQALSRRRLLQGATIGAISWATAQSALAQVALRTSGEEGNILVVVFLRGGADGLSLVVPCFEDNYYRVRPNLAIAPPKGSAGVLGARALDLDGRFGLHPSLAPLLPFYREGELLAIQAVGSKDQTRSHFEAMSAMERGMGTDDSGPASGWIARHLAATETANDTPLRAVAFGSTMPDSLRGATNAVALSNLTDFRLEAPQPIKAEVVEALRRQYATGKDEVAHAGRETLAVLERLNRLNPDLYQPENGAEYPDNGLGKGFRQAATLIRANLGLEVAFLEMGGWDTHVTQGAGVGWLPGLLDELGKATASFMTDMGGEMKRINVVIMTEFGRRLAENQGLGTDHGHGSMMMVMGGGVKGGQVYSKWPGISTADLEGPGDLRITTDYRDVLGEILANRFNNRRLGEVFPGHTRVPLGLTA